MRRCHWSVFFTGIFLCFSCSGSQLSRARTPGCVPFAQTPDRVVLVENREVTVPQPCPMLGRIAFATGISFLAEASGLRVRFEVQDPVQQPGAFREERGARDAVVIFPQGEGPGRPVLELAIDAVANNPNVYRVEELIPWETWGMRGPDGSFPFECSVLDRDERGDETELHVRIALRITPETVAPTPR